MSFRIIVHVTVQIDRYCGQNKRTPFRPITLEHTRLFGKCTERVSESEEARDRKGFHEDYLRQETLDLFPVVVIQIASAWMFIKR